MFTRIRNASSMKFQNVEMPASKLKVEVARVLKREGFIKNFSTKKKKSFEELKVSLQYGESGEPVINGIKSVSTPGRRMYVNKRELPKIAQGLEVAIISTPQGLLTSREAFKKGIGGEILLIVW